MPQGSSDIKSSAPAIDDKDPNQSIQKSYYNQGSPLQIQDFTSSHRRGAQQPPCDAFSMDSMQQSLRAASVISPFSQQQQHYIQQQTLPPRSPQLSHQAPTYFSPGRGRANSNSPITTNGFSHLTNANDFHAQSVQAQNSVYDTMPNSPYLSSSRGPSPVNSEYSVNGGNINYSYNGLSHSQQISTDRHMQRQTQQNHQDSNNQFASIDQHAQAYDGCIYQVI